MGYLHAPATGEPLVIYTLAAGLLAEARVLALREVRVYAPGLYRLRVTGDPPSRIALASARPFEPASELRRLGKGTLRALRSRGPGTRTALADARARRALSDALRHHVFGSEARREVAVP